LDQEVNAKEGEFIRALRSNDPKVGYNRWPRFGPADVSVMGDSLPATDVD
jgi:hypothetical protein